MKKLILLITLSFSLGSYSQDMLIERAELLLAELDIICGLPAELQNQLIGYWPFCGDASNVNGNMTTKGVIYNAGLTNDRFGNEDSAYIFSNKKKSNIIINTSPELKSLNGDITVSVWFYPTSTALGYIVDRDVCGVAKDWGLQWRNGMVKMRTLNIENDIVSRVLNVNTWYHIVITRKNGVFKMYVNSRLSSARSGFNYKFTNINSVIKIGGQSCNSPAPNFEGKIDDIGIWDRALTDSEIGMLYNHNGVQRRM